MNYFVNESINCCRRKLLKSPRGFYADFIWYVMYLSRHNFKLLKAKDNLRRINHIELLFPTFFWKISDRWQNYFGYLSSKSNYLKNNNRIKAFNPKTPFHYYDLLDYIKNQNNIYYPNKKTWSQTTYENILIHAAKNFIIFGERINEKQNWKLKFW